MADLVSNLHADYSNLSRFFFGLAASYPAKRERESVMKLQRWAIGLNVYLEH